MAAAGQPAEEGRPVAEATEVSEEEWAVAMALVTAVVEAMAGSEVEAEAEAVEAEGVRGQVGKEAPMEVGGEWAVGAPAVVLLVRAAALEAAAAVWAAAASVEETVVRRVVATEDTLEVALDGQLAMVERSALALAGELATADSMAQVDAQAGLTTTLAALADWLVAAVPPVAIPAAQAAFVSARRRPR